MVSPAEQIAQMLALNVNIEPVLINDITTPGGQAWAVRLTVSHPSGLFFCWTMHPNNARDTARLIKQCALECATKIVPAAKPIIQA